MKSAAAGQRLPATNGRVGSSEQSSMPGNLSAFRSSSRPSILVITARSDFADHYQRKGSEEI
jgi:hypothetical protein